MLHKKTISNEHIMFNLLKFKFSYSFLNINCRHGIIFKNESFFIAHMC